MRRARLLRLFEEAKAKFPLGWKALKPYLRLTPQPK
jgi:hypothetical protein